MALIAVVAVAVTALLPLLGAGFHSDDLLWLAFVRHAETPWPAFVETQIFGYFYRPSAFVYWWLAERLAGSSASLHHALSIAVHAASGVLFATWLWRSGVSLLAATLAAAALVASLPFAGTAMWLSSRNETLAIVAGLGALALVPGADARRAVGIGALLAISCTAKETGLLFATAAALQALVGSAARRPWRVATAWAAVLPAMGALLARQWITLPVEAQADGVGEPAMLFHSGVLPWWTHWPSALAGWGLEHPPLAIAALAVAGIAAVNGLLGLRREAARPLLAAAIVLVALPAPLQSPITSLVLGQDGAEAYLVNLRFFATATVGLAVLVGQGLDHFPRGVVRVTALLLASAMVLVSAYGADAQATRWSIETRSLGAPLDVARRLPATLADGGAGPCVVDVTGTGLGPGLAPYLDSAVRMLAVRGKPPSCLVLADGLAPHFAFFAPPACRIDAGWEAFGLAAATLDGQRLADRFGSVCQIGLRPMPSGVVPSRRWALDEATPAR